MGGKAARITLVEFALVCPYCDERCVDEDVEEYSFSEAAWPARVRCVECGRVFGAPGLRLNKMFERGIAPAPRRKR